MLSPARASCPLSCDVVQIISCHFIPIVHMSMRPWHIRQTFAAASERVSWAPASPLSNPIYVGWLESFSSSKFLVRYHFIWLFFSWRIKFSFCRLSFDFFAPVNSSHPHPQSTHAYTFMHICTHTRVCKFSPETPPSFPAILEVLSSSSPGSKLAFFTCCAVLSCSVVSNSLRRHGL